MFCTNCGQENRPGSRFCRSCGTPLELIQSVEPPQTVEQAAAAVGEVVEAGITEVPFPTSEGREKPEPTIDEEIHDQTRPENDDESAETADDEPYSQEGQVIVEPPLSETVNVEPGPTEAEQVIEAAQAPSPQVSETSNSLETADMTSVPVGTLLQKQYKITEVRTSESGMITYVAEDQRRCYSCMALQTDEEAQFCEMCGAELKTWPLVELTHVTTPVNPDDIVLIEDKPYQLVRSTAAPAIEMPAQIPRLLGIRCGYLTDSGSQREVNEDSILVLQLTALCENQPAPNIGFYIVADGIGGHEAGEVASHAAVQALGASAMQSLLGPMLNCEPLTVEAIHERLKTVVYNANLRILGLRHQAGSETNMGCTLAAALIYESRAVIANAGDSRTYVMKEGKLSQISKDHSLVARMVDRGEIKPEDIYIHSQKNVIYRSLGDKADLELDIFDVDLAEGDRLLLCSDGLWEMVHDPMIEETLLAHYENQEACKQLVKLANQAGGEDNISVIVVSLHSL